MFEKNLATKNQMLKICAAVPVACAALWTLPAQADFIVGANVSTSLTGEVEADIDSGIGNIGSSGKSDIETRSGHIYIGSKNSNNDRVLLGVERINWRLKDSGGEELKALGIRLDWQVVYGEHIQPYWGLGFGFYQMQDVDVLEATDVRDDKLNGAALQAAAGVKFELAETIELDLNVQGQYFMWEDVKLLTSKTSIDTYHITVGAGLAFRF